MQHSLGFPLTPKPFDGSSRRVEAGAAFHWLHQGCLLFRARPSLWLAGASLTLLAAFACLMLPWLGTALVFLPLPALMAGMLLVCRELAEGREPSFGDLLAGFRSKTGGLALIGLTTALLFFCGLWCGKVLAGGSTGYSASLFSGLVALLLAVPIFLAAVFAPALLFFNDMPALEAMKASLNACVCNWPALLVFAVLFLMLALLTAISAGLGLLLLIPVMSGALFAAYRDIFPGT